jgi:hypothetical protein
MDGTMSKFNDDLMMKMISLGYPKNTLTAADLKPDMCRAVALAVQKRGGNPTVALEAATIAKLEKETGLPIFAAIERNKMSPGSRTRRDATIGQL